MRLPERRGASLNIFEYLLWYLIGKISMGSALCVALNKALGLFYLSAKKSVISSYWSWGDQSEVKLMSILPGYSNDTNTAVHWFTKPIKTLVSWLFNDSQSSHFFLIQLIRYKGETRREPFSWICYYPVNWSRLVLGECSTWRSCAGWTTEQKGEQGTGTPGHWDIARIPRSRDTK